MDFGQKIYKALGITKHITNTLFNQTSTWSAGRIEDLRDFFHDISGSAGTIKKYIDSYETNPVIYMVVNKLASTTAALPRVYHDAKGEIVENSEIEQLLKKPNSYQSEIEFRQQLNEYLALSGNAFILRIDGIGMGHELEVLDSANVRIVLDTIGDVFSYEYIDNMGKRHIYEPEEILHIKASNNLKTNREEKYWGLSALRANWTVVRALNDLFKAKESIWKNKGFAGILTNKSDIPLKSGERKELQDEYTSEIGGAVNANGVKVSSGNLAYIQLGMSPGDLKLLEGFIEGLRVIAAAYKLPSVLFNDTENSTYNNVSESKSAAYTDAYIPFDEKVNQKLGDWLGEIFSEDVTIVIDISNIEELKYTTNEISNRLNALPPTVANRIVEALSINQALDMMGLEPIVGGEKLLGKSNNKEDEKEIK